MTSKREKAIIPTIFLILCYIIFLGLFYISINYPEKITLCWDNFKKRFYRNNRNLLSIVPVINNENNENNEVLII